MEKLNLELASWDLPKEVLKCYSEAGIVSLFEWQAQCLRIPGVLDGNNIVYSAPTSAGKTLVAEILLLSRLMQQRGRKAIFVLPFISVAREKTLHLRKLMRLAGIKVEGFMGASGSSGGGLQSCDLAVCTIEKANALFNRLIEERNTQLIGTVVVDELHSIADSGRGYILELLLTKLKYCDYTNRSMLGEENGTQIIGMSATLPNLNVVAKWLQAKLYVTDFRPVPLIEFLCHGTNLVQEQLIKELTRAKCRTLGEELPEPPDVILSKSVIFGVAYHHAGLTMEEREWIERCFIGGGLRVLVATSTLSSGVNLPSQRVIIRAPWGQPGRPGPYLTPAVYRQMTGRAGRKGIDTKGESILMCKKMELTRGKELMASNVDAVVSALNIKAQTSDQILRAVLEVIAGGLTKSVTEVKNYLSMTFMAIEDNINPDDIVNVTTECINYLHTNSFVVIDDLTGTCSPSQLGSAAIASSLGPQQATSVYSDLLQARKGVVLENELHMVFMVTPVYMQSGWHDLDWKHFHYLWTRLSSGFRRVAQVVGLCEKFIVTKANQVLSIAHPKPGSIEAKQYSLHVRFYTAMALHELINENSLAKVAGLFRCSRGFLQCLQQQASTFCGMVVAFCDRLGWHNLRTLLSGFAERLAFGVRGDLTDLVKVDGLDAIRARCLHTNGITSIAALATVSVTKLETILRKAVPYCQEKCDINNGWLASHPDMSLADAVDLLISRAGTWLNEDLARLGIHTNIQTITKLKTDEVVVNNLTTINNENEDNMVIHADNIEGKGDEVAVPLTRVESDGVDSGYNGSYVNWNKTLDGEELANNHVDSLTFDLSHVSVSSSRLHKSVLNHSLLSESGTMNILSEHSSPAVSVPGTPEMFDDSMDNSKCSSVNDSILGASPVLHASKRHRQVGLSGSFLGQVGTPSPVTKRCKANTPSSSNSAKRRSTKLADPLSPSTMQAINNSAFWKTQVETKAPILSQQLKYEDVLRRIRELRRDHETVVAVHFAVNKNRLNARPVRKIGDRFTESKDNKENEACSIGGIGIDNGTSQVVGICFGRDSFKYISILSSDLQECPDKLIELLTVLFNGPICCMNLHDTVLIARRLLYQAEYSQKVNIHCDSVCLTTAAWILGFDEAKLSPTQIIDKALLLKGTPNQFKRISQDWRNIIANNSPANTERKSLLFVECCMLIKDVFITLLKKCSELYEAYRTIEIPLIDPLIAMELRGMPVDISTCTTIKTLLHKLLSDLETKAETSAGTRFAIGKSSDVAQVLFVKLGLHASGKLRDAIGKGARKLSTSKEVLNKLTKMHSLPSIILQWRQVHNSLTTVVYPILQYSTPSMYNSKQSTICGLFDPYTATGRVTMHNPNLQTMQKILELEDENEPIQLRDLFVAPQDWQFMSVDYSQLELRVLAHLCEDVNLVRILSSPSGDVFRIISASIMQIQQEQVTDAERHKAKQICYGLIYGMGVVSLSEQLEISEAAAQSFIQQFHATFPGVQKWIMQCVDSARKLSYITTVAGRRRALTHINSNNPSLKAQAERQAVNSTVQGSAADIFKTALININKRIKDDFAVLVMQLHDEALLLVRDTSLKDTAQIVRDCMLNSYTCVVPMRVKILTGPRWGTLTPFQLT